LVATNGKKILLTIEGDSSARFSDRIWAVRGIGRKDGPVSLGESTLRISRMNDRYINVDESSHFWFKVNVIGESGSSFTVKLFSQGGSSGWFKRGNGVEHNSSGGGDPAVQTYTMVKSGLVETPTQVTAEDRKLGALWEKDEAAFWKMADAKALADKGKDKK
tara:strand:+ start:303 stop:788 length:486 start_codon:yes stop_codon:yes gene_type:complete